MLSKNKIKFIRSLERKKERNESGLFLAEGNKLVADLLPYFSCELLVAKPSWMATQGDLKAKELIVADENDIEKASLLKNPQDVIAIFVQSEQILDKSLLQNELNLALDGIQDPGNLGTIIRIADWFGIHHVICSPDTADIYNPKTVQATMGSLARMQIFYESLPELLTTLPDLPVYGTFLNGENIYTNTLTTNGLIVMGNEGNGIRPEVEKHINRRLYIPSFPLETDTAESLNVAVATAITCAEFRRQQVQSLGYTPI
ncbi:MAG: RNA methyltransferase [Candidatus Symbiothrix sp.]|jgi:TrmH family RNA methyltransferase|nr:RNA methyltransferase [Candidatus Symbiothrix sp.]